MGAGTSPQHSTALRKQRPGSSTPDHQRATLYQGVSCFPRSKKAVSLNPAPYSCLRNSPTNTALVRWADEPFAMCFWDSPQGPRPLGPSATSRRSLGKRAEEAHAKKPACLRTRHAAERRGKVTGWAAAPSLSLRKPCRRPSMQPPPRLRKHRGPGGALPFPRSTTCGLPGQTH